MKDKQIANKKALNTRYTYYNKKDDRGEKNKMKKYKIVFGNRRFMACKKLGMKTIPAMIDGKVNSILINNIETTENIRTNIGNVAELMTSIKERGLLQPISLATETNTKDFIIDNTIENIQRKDISPIELGKVCKKLHDKFDMSQSEVAARLGIGPTVVNTAMRLYAQVPAGFTNNIGYCKGGRVKHNQISVITAKLLIQTRVSKTILEQMFELAYKNELGKEHVKIFSSLVKNGIKPEIAIKEVMKAQSLVVHMAAKKDEIAKLREKYEGESQALIISKIIKGIYPAEPKLVY